MMRMDNGWKWYNLLHVLCKTCHLVQDEDRVLVRRHGGEQGAEVGGAGGQDHTVGGVAPGQSGISTVAA